MAITVTPLSWFVAWLALVQLSVAVLYLRRSTKGPYWFLAGILFVLNGLVALVTIGTTMGDSLESYRLSTMARAFDAPTGGFVALLAWSIWRQRESAWRRDMGIIVVTWCLLSLIFMTSFRAMDWFGDSLADLMFEKVPLYTGYTLLTAAVLQQWRKAPDQAGTMAFLVLGWVSRPIDFAAGYGADRIRFTLIQGTLGSNPASTLLMSGFTAAMAMLLVWVLFLISRRRKREDFLLLAGLGAASTIGLQLHFNNGHAFVYVVTTSTAFLFRPLFVGMADHRANALRSIAIASSGLLGFALAKSLTAGLTDTSFWNLSQYDFLASAMGLLASILCAALWGPKAIAKEKPPRITHRERLLQLLYEAPDWVGQDEIEERLGIAKKNIAAEVRKIRQSDQTQVIEERLIGVRGRKVYRLTSS